MVLFVYFPKVISVGTLSHRTGLLHTSFGHASSRSLCDLVRPVAVAICVHWSPRRPPLLGFTTWHAQGLLSTLENRQGMRGKNGGGFKMDKTQTVCDGLPASDSGGE